MPRLAVLFAGLALMLATLTLPRTARAAEPLKVIVPEKDNLQYLAFWFAKAGGFFEREGIDLQIVVAPPAGTKGTPPIDGMLESGEADAAVIAPPVYLRMIGAKSPIVIVANLFQNSPYALIVRRDVAVAHHFSAEAPLRDRLASLKGITIGYPPASFGRLRALLTSQGLDIEKDVKTAVLLSRDQGKAFKVQDIEAAFLATPNLEKTIIGDDAVVAVAEARGEVAELANRQTHVFAVARHTLEARRDLVVSAARAIAAAEKRLHTAQPEVVDALAKEFPARDRRELEAIVKLYEPAVPVSPEVRAQDLAPALALIPEGVPKPDLASMDLAPFVATDIVRDAAGADTAGRKRWLPIALGVLALFAIVFVVRRRRANAASV